MAADQDAVIYVYENVGGPFQTDSVSKIEWSATDLSAVIYVYENVTL